MESFRKGSILQNENTLRPGEGGRDLATYCRELGVTEAELVGKKILDIGSGLRAELAQSLTDRAEVVSFSPDYADPTYAENVKYIDTPVVAGLGEALPFHDESFDTVVMLHVVEHISESVLAKTVQEIVRVLKSGGIAYISPLLEGVDPFKIGHVSIIRNALAETGVAVTVEDTGQATNLDYRDDPTGPHHYIHFNQQRVKIQK